MHAPLLKFPNPCLHQKSPKEDTLSSSEYQLVPVILQSGILKRSCSTTKKRNISDVDSNSESKTPTKKSRQPARRRGAGQHQHRKQSASPITPPKGPRKRTNEHPGLIGKNGRRTKKEVEAERAAKEANVKAVAAARVDAIAGLVDIELVQKRQETMRRQQVLRRQPSVLDVTAQDDASSGEDFNWGSVVDERETDCEMDVDSDNGTSNLSAEAAMEKQPKVSMTSNGFEQINTYQ